MFKEEAAPLSPLNPHLFERLTSATAVDVNLLHADTLTEFCYVYSVCVVLSVKLLI